MFRTFLVWGVGFLATIIISLIIMPVAIFDRSGKSANYLVRIWAKIVVFLSGARVEVKGIQNLFMDRPQVLTSNHQEAFDIPILQAFLPVQFRWISKKRAFRYPFIGWAMYFAGYIKIDRSNPRSAYRSLEDASKMLNKGVSMLIFPAGTRSKSDSVGEFRRGPFLLAIRTKTPIIPISIRGTNRIVQRGWPWIYPVKIKVFIDSPVLTDDLEDKDARRLKEDIHKVISRNFEKLIAHGLNYEL